MKYPAQGVSRIMNHESRIKRGFLLIILFFLVTVPYTLVSIPSAYASTTITAPSINVSGTVGNFYFSVNGSIAPFASVALIANDVVLRTTTADTNGAFFISSVLVQSGFSSFCLLGIDQKRLGESYTCFHIDPLTGNFTMQNVFLPPTLGLQKLEVNEGAQAVAWGYTMRGGVVTLHVDDGRVFTVTADTQGYYEIHIPVSKAGTYSLFADATYQNRSSLNPDRKTTLIVFSLSQQITRKVQETGKNFWQQLLGNPWTWILIALPIFILIIILLKKLRPELFTFIDKGISAVEMHLPFLPKHLHHKWFMGY